MLQLNAAYSYSRHTTQLSYCMLPSDMRQFRWRRVTRLVATWILRFPKSHYCRRCIMKCFVPDSLCVVPGLKLLASFTQPYGTSLCSNAAKPFLVCTEWRQVLRRHSSRYSVTTCHCLCSKTLTASIHTAPGNWRASRHAVWLRKIWFPDSLLSPHTASHSRITSDYIHLCDSVIFFILKSSLLFPTSYTATGQMRHKECFIAAGDTNCHSGSLSRLIGTQTKNWRPRFSTNHQLVLSAGTNRPSVRGGTVQIVKTLNTKIDPNYT
jgi:hypothetical protein